MGNLAWWNWIGKSPTLREERSEWGTRLVAQRLQVDRLRSFGLAEGPQDDRCCFVLWVGDDLGMEGRGWLALGGGQLRAAGARGDRKKICVSGESG